MQKKSLQVNYLFNLGYQVLLIVIPLLTMPYLARVLGAEGIGKYSFAESIVTYFVLFANMGVAYYGQREIAFLQDDRKRRTILFWETKLFSIIVALIATMFFVCFSLFQHDKALYLVLSVNILNVALDVTWLFQGMEEFGTIVIRNAIAKVLNIIYIFCFVKSKEDLVIYALGMGIFTTLGHVTMWPSVKRYVDLPDIRSLKPFRNFRIIFSLFVPTIAIQVYTVLDTTMIGVITGDDAQNGFYRQAIQLSRILLTFVTSLGTVMISKIGYHYKQKNTELIKEFMYRGYNFVWFLGIPLCFGLIGIADNVVPWFYGDGYTEVIALIRILSFLILAIGINNVTGIQYLIPTERQNTFTFTVIIGAIVNFGLNLALIPIIQAKGAAFASVAAETVIAIIQIIIVRKEISPLKIITLSWKYLIAGGVMLIVLRYQSGIFEPTIINTIFMVITGVVIYVTSLFLLRDKFLMGLVESALSKVRGYI